MTFSVTLSYLFDMTEMCIELVMVNLALHLFSDVI